MVHKPTFEPAEHCVIIFLYLSSQIGEHHIFNAIKEKSAIRVIISLYLNRRIGEHQTCRVIKRRVQ